MRCPECGVPLDELPFERCETHRRLEPPETSVTDDERSDLLNNMLAALTMERSGDD